MHRIRLLVALLATALLLAVPLAHGAASTLVVSQIYAGGGNSGAAFTNDFVEIFNRGSSAMDVSGWSIQYASAASASWQVTTLSGSIQAGHYYLVQLASSAAVGSPLPTPDATGTTNLANTAGKIALVHGTTALSCGASPGSGPQRGRARFACVPRRPERLLGTAGRSHGACRCASRRTRGRACRPGDGPSARSRGPTPPPRRFGASRSPLRSTRRR